MKEWIHEMPLKDIAFKAIIVRSSLLLQKPSQKSKLKDRLKSWENQMELWHAREIMNFLTIQKDFRVSNTPSTIGEISSLLVEVVFLR